MVVDTDSISSWYVLHQGYKVYAACPSCGSTKIAYHKARAKGLKGIAPCCLSCGKGLPVRFKPESQTPRWKKVTVNPLASKG